MLTVNSDIADELTRHAIGLQRLANGTVRKIIAILNRSDVRLIERLLQGASDLSRARQEALLADIRRIVSSAYSDAIGGLQIDLDRLAEYEVGYQGDMFSRIVPVNMNTIFPSSEQILASVNSRPFQGRIMREWFADIEAVAFQRLRNVIRAGIVEGRTIDQIAREIRGTRAQGFKDGILEVNRRAAQVTARTAIAHTSNAARDILYRGNRAHIKGVQWTATLDGRTSAVCRARDGQVYPVDSGPRPPAHPNCRSSVIPVMKSLRDMGLSVANFPAGTRASMNGQVSADETYDTWLRRQPVEFQNDVLGVNKARLFRAGLTLDRYVSRAGDEYTLEELRQREAGAWALAN